MKNIFAILLCSLAIAAMPAAADAANRVNDQRAVIPARNLAKVMKGARQLSPAMGKALGTPAPKSAEDIVNGIIAHAEESRSLARLFDQDPGLRTDYSWALMDGKATFHDDFGNAEFNLDIVEYETGILNATNASDIYALRPYGSTYPYYNDLVESNMVNTGQGAMIVNASDYSYVSVGSFYNGVTITWDDGTTEDIMMMSYNWLMEFFGHDASVVKNAGMGGVNDGGHIYFPCINGIAYTTASILTYYQNEGYTGDDLLQAFYTCDSDGLYGFCLPGVTVDPTKNQIHVTTPQYCFDDNNFTLHFKAGDNIKVFHYNFYAAYSEDVFEDVVANGSGGSYEAEGDVTLSLNSESIVGNNKIYMAIVAGDSQGNIKDGEVIELYLVPTADDADHWTEPKNATLTDDLIGPLYSLPVTTYGVTYQQSIDNPDYYRIVSPFAKDGHWAYASNLIDLSDSHHHEHYIYLNATDPDAVILETSPLGYTMLESEGEGKISSVAAFNIDINGNDLATEKSAGNCGKLADKKFTFPTKSLMVANTNYQEGAYFFTNKSGKFSIQLDSTVSGIEGIGQETVDTDAVYFDLQGQRVSNPAAAPGVYIKRTNGSSSKVFLK